jgi:hypothetical protein
MLGFRYHKKVYLDMLGDTKKGYITMQPEPTLEELLSALSLTEAQRAVFDSKKLDLSTKLQGVPVPAVVDPLLPEGEGSGKSSRRSSDSKGSQPTARGLFYSYTPGSGKPRFSDGSPAGLATAEIGRAVFLTYEVTDSGIQIIVNSGQRPPTAISGSQGDHVTAYATFLQSVCGLVDGEDVQEAPGMLYEATQCFIATPHKLEEFARFFFKKQQDVEENLFPRTDRKRLTYELKELNACRKAIDGIAEPQLSRALKSLVGRSESEAMDIESLKAAIKRGNQVLFAQFVVEIGNQLIKDYNKEDTAALPKLSQNPDPAEGNRVKEAMKKLRLINKVLALRAKLSVDHTPDEERMLIDDFKESCQEIIKAANPSIKKGETVDSNFIEGVSCCGLRFSLTMASAEETKLAILGMNMDAMKFNDIGKLFNDLFDFKAANVGQVSRIDEDEDGTVREGRIRFKEPLCILYDVTMRHIKFMFVAFRNLETLDLNYKEELIKEFLNCIMAAPTAGDNFQGWCHYVSRYPDEATVTKDSFYEVIRSRLGESKQDVRRLRSALK